MSAHQVTSQEAERARSWLAANFIPCHSCDNPQAGPIHRKSERLWHLFAKRAREHGGTDPVSGRSLADAERHLSVILQRAEGSRS